MSLNWRRAQPPTHNAASLPPRSNRRRGAAVAPSPRTAFKPLARYACIAIPSAGRRIVVNQRVTPAVTEPQSLDRVSPMQHGFEAALLFVDLLPAILPYPRQNNADAPPPRRSRPVADTRQLEHGITYLSAPSFPTKV